ncbi:MAG: 5'-methylthioadenosine/S-adenosylhomocysteine nucleosidase [Roseburia sp.]
METYDFYKNPSILIQGAMESETEYLIGQLAQKACVKYGNWSFYTGFLGESKSPVIISRTFQGMVNAAAATTLALTHFSPRAVINQGIAGGHDSTFYRGDIVLGTRAVPMGAMIRPFAKKGEGICESDFTPLGIEVFRESRGKTEKVLDFPCDHRLLAAAEHTAKDYLAAEEALMKKKAVCKRTRKIEAGVLGSADEWNNQFDRIVLLRERYKTTTEDMESAAVAQLCDSYGIPFLGIRIISNSIVTGEELDESVAEDCQRYVIRVVENVAGAFGTIK